VGGVRELDVALPQRSGGLRQRALPLGRAGVARPERRGSSWRRRPLQQLRKALRDGGFLRATLTSWGAGHMIASVGLNGLQELEQAQPPAVALQEHLIVGGCRHAARAWSGSKESQATETTVDKTCANDA